MYSRGVQDRRGRKNPRKNPILKNRRRCTAPNSSHTGKPRNTKTNSNFPTLPPQISISFCEVAKRCCAVFSHVVRMLHSVFTVLCVFSTKKKGRGRGGEGRGVQEEMGARVIGFSLLGYLELLSLLLLPLLRSILTSPPAPPSVPPLFLSSLLLPCSLRRNSFLRISKVVSHLLSLACFFESLSSTLTLSLTPSLTCLSFCL
jgi:hypothetical protein